MIYSEREPFGPETIMDYLGEQESKPERVDVKKLISEKIVQCADTYSSILRQDSSEVEVRELSDKSKQELFDHAGHLDHLKEYLQEYTENISQFRKAALKIEENLCSVKLFRQGDLRMGEGFENAQTQLEFFTQGIETEEENETTYAVGLQQRTDAQRTLETRDRQLENRRIQIKTVKAFINPDTGDRVVLYLAGIQLSMIKGEVRAHGIKYVGTRAHTYDLGKSTQFSPAEFNALQKHVIGLATHLNRPPQPKP